MGKKEMWPPNFKTMISAVERNENCFEIVLKLLYKPPLNRYCAWHIIGLVERQEYRAPVYIETTGEFTNSSTGSDATDAFLE